jgi:hypothetical protein
MVMASTIRRRAAKKIRRSAQIAHTDRVIARSRHAELSGFADVLHGLRQQCWLP